MISNDIFINSVLVAAAFLMSFSLFPFSLRFSRWIGAQDVPSARKIHKKITPRAGGVAFFVSFSVFISLARLYSSSFKLSFLIGGALIFLVGLFDDVKGLSPIQKLAGQAGAAAVPVFFGTEFYRGPASHITLLWGGASVLWMLFLTNAINLSDGVDGLAAGSSISFSLTLALFAFIIPERDVFWTALLLGAPQRSLWAIAALFLSVIPYHFYRSDGFPSLHLPLTPLPLSCCFSCPYRTHFKAF